MYFLTGKNFYTSKKQVKTAIPNPDKMTNLSILVKLWYSSLSSISICIPQYIPLPGKLHADILSILKIELK